MKNIYLNSTQASESLSPAKRTIQIVLITISKSYQNNLLYNPKLFVFQLISNQHSASFQKFLLFL